MEASLGLGTRNVTVERSAAGASRAAGVTVRATGTTMRAAGITAQAVGKSTKVAGKGATRAGAALSATGFGAIVGVPLMALGVGATAAGTATDAGGKALSRAGKQVSRVGGRIGKLGKVMQAKEMIDARVKVTRNNLFIWGIGFPFWFGFIFPVAVLSLMLAGAVSVISDISQTERTVTENGVVVLNEDGTEKKETLWVGVALNAAGQVVSFTANTVAGVVDSVTGWDLSGILSSFSPVNLFGITHLIVFLMGVFMLMAIVAVYLGSGISPLGGDGGVWKMLVFGLCICGYLIPFFNIFPWFFLYTIVVWFNPL